MGRNRGKTPKIEDEAMKREEVMTMLKQLSKDSSFQSLLYVTRKLGEIEGMISMQTEPASTLIHVQNDLQRVYDKLAKEAGIEQLPYLGGEGIGGDRAF
jgi:hypothetical protein